MTVTLKKSTVVQTNTTVELRDIPIKEWPEECLKHISRGMVKRAIETDLFPKDLIIAYVEKSMALSNELFSDF